MLARAQVEKLAAAKGRRAAMLINPQWSLTGQLISDFGFGPWKKAKEDLIATFTEVYRRAGGCGFCL